MKNLNFPGIHGIEIINTQHIVTIHTNLRHLINSLCAIHITRLKAFFIGTKIPAKFQLESYYPLEGFTIYM